MKHDPKKFDPLPFDLQIIHGQGAVRLEVDGTRALVTER